MRTAKDRIMEIRNYDLFNYYYERLINIALAEFEWKLPETCDRLYFEKMLLYRGTATMLKPENTDFWLSLGYVPIAGNNRKLSNDVIKDYLNLNSEYSLKRYEKLFNNPSLFNVYGYPCSIAGVGFNGEQIATNEWELLYDNMTRTPLINKIRVYATLLWECHMTLRNNLRQQNTPYIVTTSRNKSFSVKQFFKALFNFAPVVECGAGAFAEDEIKVLDLKSEYKANEMLDLLHGLWEEALNMLGISTQSGKKERLVADEVAMDRMGDIIELNARLLNRREFCDIMNKKYKLDMSVKIAENLDTRFPMGMLKKDLEEGVVNE